MKVGKNIVTVAFCIIYFLSVVVFCGGFAALVNLIFRGLL